MAENYKKSWLAPTLSPSVNVFDSIMEISKNPVITLLALDASKGNLQLFHHSTILGGNWANKTEKIVAIQGFENDASPIKLIDKLIKESKGKTSSISKFGETMGDESKLRNLKNLKTDFHYMNIIPYDDKITKEKILNEFYHAIQFCFLCYKGKISPVLYTLDKSRETSLWFSNLQSSTIKTNRPTK